MAEPARKPQPREEVAELRPGLLWLRMPLPFQLDHINLWALREDDGWVLVDCGLGDDTTRAAWRRIFAGAMEGRPVRRILVTHHHPDHFGLGRWLAAETGAPLHVSAPEIAHARWLCDLDDAEAAARLAAYYRRHGAPEAAEAAAMKRGNDYARRMDGLPERTLPLQLGGTTPLAGEDWQVIAGYGHSRAQACLFSPARRILIAGDQVLPKITPNVSAYWWEEESDPLAGFLETLARLRALPRDTLVLPSHGHPFEGLHARLDALADHHRDRLDELRAAVAEAPLTCAEAMAVLFRRALDPHQVFFAMGEALAHLNHLVALDEVVRRENGGLVRFHRP